MQTNSTGKENKPSSKGKNARFAGGDSEDSAVTVSHERLVLLSAHLGGGDLFADFGLVDRAFADYVFGSLILHFFCVNFIN